MFNKQFCFSTYQTNGSLTNSGNICFLVSKYSRGGEQQGDQDGEGADMFSIFKIQCFLVDFRGGEQQQDGEGADQHRDGAGHAATEMGLHGPGENNQKKLKKEINNQPNKIKTQTNNHTINQPTN